MTSASERHASLASVLIATAALLVCVPASLSRACSAVACSPPVRLFGGDQTVPGDLVYFEVMVDEPGKLALRSKAGVAIAADIKTIGAQRVFAPMEPIAAGTDVVLEYTTVCMREIPGSAPETLTFEFKTGAPAGSATLSQGSLMVEDVNTTNAERGSRTTEIVRYVPPSRMFPRHLVTHDISVDGMKLSSFNYRTTGDDTLQFVLWANCEPTDQPPPRDTCGLLTGTTLGKHQILAQTTVVGLSEQPEPVGLNVELKCSAADLTNAAQAGGAAPAAHGGGASAPPRDADCAVRAPGASSGFAWPTLVAACALVLRRRSRSARRRR